MTVLAALDVHHSGCGHFPHPRVGRRPRSQPRCANCSLRASRRRASVGLSQCRAALRAGAVGGAGGAGRGPRFGTVGLLRGRRSFPARARGIAAQRGTISRATGGVGRSWPRGRGRGCDVLARCPRCAAHHSARAGRHVRDRRRACTRRLAHATPLTSALSASLPNSLRSRTSSRCPWRRERERERRSNG